MKKLCQMMSLLFCLTSCGGNTPIKVTIQNNNDLQTIQNESEKYENIFLEDRIPNQWNQYGIGDPFIYRFNGYYYLLCSTKGTERGVKGWKSLDLMHWEEVQNGVNKKGFVVDPSIDESFDAWASEVYYLDGTFYLVASRHGEGHYVYTSTSPEGPFKLISNRIDDSFDGSMFMDIDGKMVMLYRGLGNVYAKYFSDDMRSVGENIVISNTSLVGNTEGPEYLVKDGVRYYFYTGNGVTQRAYRVDYSYSPINNNTFQNSPVKQAHNVLLNTDDDFYGLGHCCVFMGPDLDSYYMGFHNSYKEGNYEGRRFNLGRMLFNGTEVSMQHIGLYDNIVPNLPDYQSLDEANLETVDSFKLSKDSTKESFTVEYNFVGNGKNIFSYQDNKNYGYASFDGDKIEIHQVKDGQDSLKGSINTYRKYKLDCMHTLRLGYKNGLMDVSFDYQEIANDVQVGTFSAGKVGYNSFSKVGALTFNNTAQGDSDKEVEKQENIPANSYNQNLSKLTNSKIIPTDTSRDQNIVQGSYQMELTPGDYATYVDYVSENGSYGLDMVVPSTSMGKTIGVQIDGKTIYKYTIPYEEQGNNYLRLKIADLKLTKGNHNITIVSFEETFHYQMMYLEKNYNVEGTTYEADLKSYPENGVSYPTFFNKDDDGFYSENNSRYLVTFGNGGFEDLEMSVKISLTGINGTGTVGLVLCADNWAFNNIDLDNYNSIQGYYFAINSNKVQIILSNYQYSDESCRDIVTLENDVPFILKAVKKGKKLSLFVNDQKLLETFAPMGRTRGACGIYANNTSARFNDVKIKIL